MIKAKITPLNVSNELIYKCEICGDFGTIILENSSVNTDNDGNILGEIDGEHECSNGHTLK